MMNASTYQLLRPGLAVPWGQTQKKPQVAVFDSSCSRRRRLAAPKVQQTTGSANHDKFRGIVKPWYKEFPETMWNITEDSLETLKKKDREPNQSGWSTDADFNSSFAESIVFDKNLYKYGILGCKTNVDKIMNGGVISACDRNKIIRCLENIEDDIELGKFEWNDGVDVHTNIVKALADKPGEIRKDLVITNKYDSCLMILEMWCKTYIDQIGTQMKQFQVALVLLALRNDCLVLPSGREVQDNTLLETLVLPSLKMLEHDASDLRSFLGFIYSLSDGVINLRSRFSEDFPVSRRSTIADFARSINYGIPDHLLQLLEKFFSWRNWPSVTPHGQAATYEKMRRKFTIDEHTRGNGHLALSKCLNIGVSELPDDSEIQDAKYHLFSSGEVVLEMINMFIKIVENMTVGLEKIQISHPRGYDDVMGYAHFLTSKGIAMETAYGVVHLCLEKQVQPSELTLEDLARIDFPCERAHVLLHDKVNVFGKFTKRDRDASKEMIKWCCKLQIGPKTIFPRYIIYF